MKNRFYVGVLLIFLMALTPMLAGPTRVAVAADPVTLELYDPSGAVEVTNLFAPRVANLHGKTICEAAHVELWEAKRTFPVIRELLQKQFPTAKFIPFTEFPDTYGDLKVLIKRAKEKGCQAFIVGNAG